MLLRGAKHAEIAEALGTSEKTVERLLANNRDRIQQLGIA